MSKTITFLFFLLLAFGCNKKKTESDKKYNIILIAGQSNTHFGIGLDENIDKPQEGIYQLKRFGPTNYKIKTATEPLDHHSKQVNKIGFGLTFAKLFQANDNSNDILIISCGLGGTGFQSNRWNKGDDLYNDAVARVIFIMGKYPKSELKVILWHQGENDVNNLNYAEDLDTFVEDIRTNTGHPNAPFILGGMVPFWVDLAENRILQEAVIKDTPNRVENTGFADPTLPFVIEKNDNLIDVIHFNAAGQREMGVRYFNQYLELVE